MRTCMERYAWFVAAGLWLMVFAVSQAIGAAESNKERAPHGLTSGEEALARARAVFCHLHPSADTLDLRATPTTMARPDGGLRLFWSVECSGPDGNSVGSLAIDGDTGAVVRVANDRLTPLGPMPRATGQAVDPLGLARQYAAALGLARPKALRAEPAIEKLDSGLVSVTWRDGFGRLAVTVDPNAARLCWVLRLDR